MKGLALAAIMAAAQADAATYTPISSYWAEYFAGPDRIFSTEDEDDGEFAFYRKHDPANPLESLVVFAAVWTGWGVDKLAGRTIDVATGDFTSPWPELFEPVTIYGPSVDYTTIREGTITFGSGGAPSFTSLLAYNELSEAVHVTTIGQSFASAFPSLTLVDAPTDLDLIYGGYYYPGATFNSFVGPGKWVIGYVEGCLLDDIPGGTPVDRENCIGTRPAAIPLPASALLLGASIAGLLIVRRRRA